MKGVDIGKVLRTVADTKKGLYEFAIISRMPVCRRAESEALACPQGKQASRGPGFGEGTRERTALLWPHAGVRAGQLVAMGLAGQNKVPEHQHIQGIARSASPTLQFQNGFL